MEQTILLIDVAVSFIFIVYAIFPTALLRLKNRQFTKKRKQAGDKAIYLTFDDGVDEKYTKEILSLLKKHNISATFFVVAQLAQKNSEITKQIINQGHTIGLHSLKHNNQMLQSPFGIKKDFEKSLEILNSLGVETKFFRPPWGHFSLSGLKQIKDKKLTLVLWSVIVQDWKANETAENISYKLLRKVSNGDIICLHDGRGKNEAPSRTLQALNTVIPIWISQGYKFETVEKLNGQV